MTFKITADKRNWSILKKCQVEKTDGTKVTEWRDQGIYCSNLESLAESLLQMRTREGVAEGKSILQALEDAKGEVLAALASAGIRETAREVKAKAAKCS